LTILKAGQSEGLLPLGKVLAPDAVLQASSALSKAGL